MAPLPCSRRAALRLLAGGAAFSAVGWPALAGLAQTAGAEGELFVFIHAAGGWDVTLWADPRNERRGIIEPATTANTDTAGVRRWVDAPFAAGVKTFELVRPPRGGLVFGPGIGDLADLADRLCVINGLAMNTVSHPDGAAFSVTGRHLAGDRSPAPSIDTMIANELGRADLFPLVSVQFPSFHVGEELDRRVVPLVMGDVSAVSRTLTRPDTHTSAADRDAVTAMLAEEAAGLARRSAYPSVLTGLSQQLASVRRMLGSKLQDAFSAEGLRRAQPRFDHTGYHAAAALDAAFAVEALRRGLARCVSFAAGGFDTHAASYRSHALLQQSLFDLVATLVAALDRTPHPSRPADKLADHTHVVVLSEFCRTPQVNLAGGRDHYPSNSALIISPRFRGGLSFGRTDPDHLLPAPAARFRDGERAVAPPDVLATLLEAFGIPPRRYLRDGEAIPGLLRKA